MALHSPQCPRCGYDQRGPIATWTDLCPLHGTCSECGLEFIWAEVLLPDKFEPRWCVEFVRRILAFPRRALVTLIMTFQPWRFWRDLKMSQPPRWRNLIAYLALWMIIIYVLFACTQSLVAWKSWHSETWGGGTATGVQPLEAALQAC